MQRPPHWGRLTGVIGRFAKRACWFPLIPAVCLTFLLAACGSGATAGTSPAEKGERWPPPSSMSAVARVW